MEHDEPTRSSVNYGIQQSGGVSQVGVQAVGPGARAISDGVHMSAAQLSADRTQVADLISDLRRLLEEHRDELADPDGARVAAEILHEEIERPEPDPGVVRRMLGRLSNIVQPVALLSAAITQIAEAIKTLL